MKGTLSSSVVNLRNYDKAVRILVHRKQVSTAAQNIAKTQNGRLNISTCTSLSIYLHECPYMQPAIAYAEGCKSKEESQPKFYNRYFC